MNNVACTNKIKSSAILCFRAMFHKLWSNKLHDPINYLAVGKPFLEELSEENDILIGTTAGRVLILNQTKVTT